MNFQVAVEGRPRDKAFMADITHVRSFPSVRAHVDFHRGGLCESLPTNLAGIRLFTRVHSDVEPE